jgi:hypothetical protein
MISERDIDIAFGADVEQAWVRMWIWLERDIADEAVL